MSTSTQTPADREVDVLRRIEERVLWLSLAMVDHANAARPNADGVKVGGHQGSSASMVSVMTSLWFRFLAAPDRVSVKPHASPVLHAINYLLGRLRPADMESLRAFGGLQSYPSRTKDPDPVDFSTGSVGIGATATLWAALAHRYVAGHFDVPVGGRHIALIGDAELDEGAIWEALVDPMIPRLGEVMWIVDLNRQSLDRVVPDIAAGRLRDMFAAAGWHTVTAKYGRLLGELFARPGGDDLRRRIDAMSNEEYQSLLRADVAEARERLPGPGAAGRRSGGWSATSTTRRWPARSATWAGTTCRRCSTPTARRTRSPTARPWSSPTPSRGGGRRPRATRPTTPRSSPPTRCAASPSASAATRTTPGPPSRRTPTRAGSAR